MAGGSAAIASGGIAALPGALVAIHGIDTFQSGLRQAYFGEEVDTVTSHGLQSIGISRRNANLIDTGICVVGSLGAGTISAATKALTLARTEEGAGMSILELLRTANAGSRALPNIIYDQMISDIGKNASPLVKAEYIRGLNLQQGVIPFICEIGKGIWLVPTGGTALVDAVAGIGGAVFNGVRFWSPQNLED